MRAKLFDLTLVIAVFTGAAGSALAGGDVIYQGIKDSGAAIPVPAPIPVMMYEPEYYVRFDVGAAWLSDGTLEETGSNMDLRDIGNAETMAFGSIGAGRYITRSIRVELAVDISTRSQIDNGRDHEFIDVVYTSPDHSDSFDVDLTRKEKIEFQQGIGMLNFYYDFNNRTHFTPYIGAGLGVTYQKLTRTASECLTYVDICSNDMKDSDENWNFAAAAMAGFAYRISDDIVWDTGYRYLWQNGGLKVSTPTIAGADLYDLEPGTSTVEVKDVGQHQFRTGIRLDLN